jgi:hypothetical protein
VKRFNEEVGCAPAPNAYDSQLPRSKASIALLKSQRFEEAKVRYNLSRFVSASLLWIRSGWHHVGGSGSHSFKPNGKYKLSFFRENFIMLPKILKTITHLKLTQKD